MERLEKLLKRHSDIIRTLDEKVNEFEKHGNDAVNLGMYIDRDMKVCGEAHILSNNGNLVKTVELLGSQIKDMLDSLNQVNMEIRDHYKSRTVLQ